ncbi:low temperature requirement protein A [Conexibacter sp. CPCC 206217]|uniref:low temperature requirement protein A n=1 Tax=Conexibacter sp. CPCC 206217 TaxID=3064574 RepID=UPI002726F81B|nr:low temperature requirement protein A [Conexibacter sp. CPCC 206217]MDO8210362.1 low temperature requirement protein A [Conexibacter sp. CPCC 206217]
MSRFQRAAGDPERQRATTLELFYDLVFVFAITQVSHLLLRHLDWTGVGQSALVLLVVWWAWNYTTWVTNELDPESIVVRLVLIAVMLASLLMAVAIPEAFGDRALLFAGAYVAIQVGRHLFLTFGAAARHTPERERAARILIWFAIAGVFWIAGALADGSTRTLLWLIALALDYTAPLHLYWVPGLRRATGATWEVQTSHFAERFQLFVIIALGESIVLTGATTSELDLTGERVVAFCVAFLTTAAMWWLYFNYVAQIAERRLELSTNRTKLARDGYTYLHALLVAGVIVGAVGDELTIAHPGEVLPGPEVAVSVAGPAIYLLAHSLFRWRMTGSPGWKRPAGAVACVAIGVLLGGAISGLALAALLLVVLVAVIAGEYASGRRRGARGEPTPLEALDASAPRAS